MLYLIPHLLERVGKTGRLVERDNCALHFDVVSRFATFIGAGVSAKYLDGVYIH